MKLLFDQNLAPKLASQLDDLFPGSAHVLEHGLDCASDTAIWDFAQKNDFAIVTKDEDYNTMAVVRGHPPKLIWLLLGNCKTSHVEALLRSRAGQISTFEADATASTLALG